MRIDLNQLHFLYNASAHLAAQERYPDGLLDAMSKGGAEGMKALAWAVAELSTRGEQVRRLEGYDKGKLWTADKVEACLLPSQIVQARQMVLDAVMHGLKAPEDEHAEIDEVLAELEKKKETE